MRTYMILGFGFLLLVCSCTRTVKENTKEVNMGPEVTVCKG